MPKVHMISSLGTPIPRDFVSFRGGRDEGPRLACVLQHAPPCFVYAAVFQPAEVKDRTRGATTAGETERKRNSPIVNVSFCV